MAQAARLRVHSTQPQAPLGSQTQLDAEQFSVVITLRVMNVHHAERDDYTNPDCAPAVVVRALARFAGQGGDKTG